MDDLRHGCVITSEEGYWRAAAGALQDFAERLGGTPADATQPAPHLPAIARAKSALINTNWDLCHLAAIALAWRLRAADAENPARLRALDWQQDEPALLVWPAGPVPELPALLPEILAHAGEATGFALLEKLAEGTGAPELFTRQGPVWQWLFRHFQDWCNGRPGRRGLLEEENLLLPPARIAESLAALRAAGWQLGIATGRTRAELIPTLMRFGLMEYFTSAAVVTHDEVAAGEAEAGAGAQFSKPHPFPFLRALDPHTPARALAGRAAPAGTVIIGDTVADLTAAVTIGAMPVGVLTGPGGAAAEASLRAAGARLILPDLTALPQHFASV